MGKADVGMTLELRDGRVLGYAMCGDPDGVPTFLFTTSMGSRILPRLQRQQLQDAGIRAIVPDRPGIGLSTHDPNRTVLACADDIAQVADHLGLERFVLWACNHAAKYALACAYRLPDRVTVAAIVDGAAPMDGPEALDGLSAEVRAMFDPSRQGPDSGVADIEALGELGRTDPAAADSMYFNFPDRLDVAGYEKDEMIAWLGEMLPDSCRDGRGHAFDNWLILQPWGFELEEVRTPTQLWAASANAPYPLLRWAQLLAGRLPNATLTVWDDESTWLGWLTKGPLVLAALAATPRAAT